MRAGYCDVEIPDWATHVAYWMPPQIVRHDGWWELVTAEEWYTGGDPVAVEFLPEEARSADLGPWVSAELGVPVSLTFLGEYRVRAACWSPRSYAFPVFAVAPARIGAVT